MLRDARSNRVSRRHQKKNHTDDWAAAFVDAVSVRTRGLKHRVFVGLSSGYDSGAIMVALLRLQRPFIAYSIRANEDREVVQQRVSSGAATACSV